MINKCYLFFRPLQVIPETDIDFPTRRRTANHGGIEIRAEGMKRVNYRMILSEVRHILCAYIQAAGTPIFGDLRHELRIPGERRLKPVRHTTHAIELRCHIELPFLERRLITGGDDALKTVRQSFGSKTRYTIRTDGRLLHIRPTESSGPGPTAQHLHRGFHLCAVRKRHPRYPSGYRYKPHVCHDPYPR